MTCLVQNARTRLPILHALQFSLRLMLRGTPRSARSERARIAPSWLRSPESLCEARSNSRGGRSRSAFAPTAATRAPSPTSCAALSSSPTSPSSGPSSSLSSSRSTRL
eukprot:2716854-Rhodomonas_salina.4